MPANRRVPRVVGSLKRSKAPSSRKLTCAAWTVARKRTSISRMRSSNAGSLSSILPQRNSLALWNGHFDAQDATALVVDLQCQIAPLNLENRQIVALRLYGLVHLDPFASPLCPP